MTRYEHDLLGRRCYGGIDLARSKDISALILIFPDDDSGLEPNDQTYSLLEYFWVPEGNIAERVRRDHLPYDVWARDGHLLTCPGYVFHPATIRRHINTEILPRFQVEALAYDPAFMHQLCLDLAEDGITMVEWKQTAYWMTSPIAEIERRALGGLWRHRGHPVMRWMMRNVRIRTSPADGLQRIDKEESTEKVDGPVALACAMGWCMRANKGRGGSVYEERGAIVIEDAGGLW